MILDSSFPLKSLIKVLNLNGYGGAANYLPQVFHILTQYICRVTAIPSPKWLTTQSVIGFFRSFRIVVEGGVSFSQER